MSNFAKIFSKKSPFKHAVTASGHKHVDAKAPKKPAPAGKVDKSKLELL